MPFKKKLFVNLPWLGSFSFLMIYHVTGDYNLGTLASYKVLQKYFLLPSLALTIFQPFLWKKFNLSFKPNLAGWLATFIATFFYTLDANILFFMKTATIYYTFYFLILAIIPLLLTQIGIWLWIFFKSARFR